MPCVPYGAFHHQNLPVTCAFVCSCLLLLVHSAFSQKPAKLPLVGRKPFLAAWNAPLDMCTLKYNMNISLDLFHISGSPRAVHRSQNVTIFYANRLGYYPFYTEQGVPINGGLPQNCSLEAHLHKASKDIAHYIPSEDFRGLAVIDWEYWRPQWSRNWNRKAIYRQRSRELVSQAYINVTEGQIEELARLRFEKSAMAFMQGTLQLGTQTRPKGLWGFYLYPDCHNYNVHAHNYSGSCPRTEIHRNDQLLWLWNSSTALFPALAIRKGHMDSIRNLHFSQNRVLEALRLAAHTALPYELPTYVYTRLGYRDEAMAFLSQKDLIHTIGESAALGAAGFVIWGDLNLTSSKHNCSKVKAFLSHRLGLYITNVTWAAEVCSKYLCQSNGRCKRREPQAPHYLHLSCSSYRILRNRNGTFNVTGWHSQHELQLLAERFRCHCYEGYSGENCDSTEPTQNVEDEEEQEGDLQGRAESSAVSVKIIDYFILLTHIQLLLSVTLLNLAGLCEASPLPQITSPPFDKKPFVIIWNAPISRCQYLNISLNLSAFQAITTPAKVHNQTLRLFYKKQIGLFPYTDLQTLTHYNGGIPQRGNLTASLEKAKEKFTQYIPDSLPGLAVLDWEEWLPMFDQNAGLRKVYKEMSINYTLEQYPSLDQKQIFCKAKEQFQKATRSYMEETLKLGIAERPQYLWGFYLFPDCDNYNFENPNYTGRCSQNSTQLNTQLLWLWETSTALFPSAYIPTSITGSQKVALFVRHRVQEAMRVAALPLQSCTAPIYIYLRPLLRDQKKLFMQEVDLVRSIGEAAALGATGCVLWGSSYDYNDKASCESLSTYLSEILNQYIINVTTAAHLCSNMPCKGTGHCVRKDHDSDDYLHLNLNSFNIQKSDGTFHVTGEPSISDLTEWAKKFTCYKDKRCSSTTPSGAASSHENVAGYFSLSLYAYQYMLLAAYLLYEP